MDELKPCPFCESSGDDIQEIMPELDPGRVFCFNCSADAPDWNNRPIEDALRARVAELEDFTVRKDNRIAGLVELLDWNSARVAELEAALEKIANESEWNYIIGIAEAALEREP